MEAAEPRSAEIWSLEDESVGVVGFHDFGSGAAVDLHDSWWSGGLLDDDDLSSSRLFVLVDGVGIEIFVWRGSECLEIDQVV